MGGAAVAIVYAVVLIAGLGAAGGFSPTVRRAGLPAVTIVAVVVIALPSLVQLTVAPGLLGALERNPGQIAHGQPWRLVTSLLVQDGGWSGTAFNLAALAVLGVAAERVWGARRWLIIAAACGVGAQPWGLVLWNLDRLGRSLRHLVNTVHDLTEAGIGLKVLTGQGAAIDTTALAGQLVFAIFAALAEHETGQLRPDATTLLAKTKTNR